MELSEKEFDDLYNSFERRWPLESLEKMSLEDYTNLKEFSEDYFCYWVETKTKELALIKGSTSYKFGIFRYNKEPDTKRSAFLHDDKYAWQERYGKSAEEAFKNIRSKIIAIAQSANKSDFEGIDSIDLSEMFKWKIAFLYSNKKLLNWFSRDALLLFAKHFGFTVDDNTPSWKLQNILMSKKGKKSYVEFEKELLPLWNVYQNSRNVKNQNEDSNMENSVNTASNLSKLLFSTHNLILNGAPGTGKTHLAKDIAKEMNAEVGFVQFHPSYDYTDFVEGLRPINSGNGQIGFERKDGVFKKFCEKALLSNSTDSDMLKELNDNPTVWKVSLEGTGDNPTRADCMKNGYIRLGWSEYGDVVDFSKFDGFTEYGGSVVLVAFQSKMKIGDIVLSCWSSTEIDAIGIVTGDYEYRSEGGGYPRYRTVKWLVKGIRENIVEKNRGKNLTLASVYRLSISLQDVIEIVNKYNKGNQASKKDFVFIIDEINRGEISKIFGELFFSMDPGYRGKKGLIKTQYQNFIQENNVFYDGFYVPENVYIIGTMNDIDRSVESMDFAFRRRFTFKEIKANENLGMLDELNESIREKAKQTLLRLNNAISEVDGLSSAYHIGGAYFLKLNELDNDFDKLWEYHLEGLLREYLRGMEDSESSLKKLHEAYKNGQEA
jgi:5-methylcytosine-specific restriction endonuclease McrBC GTP-binding regulatory subunit McrB